MNILILGVNYAPEPVGTGVFTAGMARYLAGNGHVVHVVSAVPHYPAWQVAGDYSRFVYERRIESGVVVTRCPLWVPRNPTGTNRLINQLSFAATSLLPLLADVRVLRPDAIIAIAPSLFVAQAAKVAAKLSRARTWLHVQDLEVDAAFATGLLRTDGFAGKCARAFERYAFSSFDRVSSISRQMCLRIIQKGVPQDQVLEFPNWGNVQVISPLSRPSMYRSEWKIATRHVALYSGTISKKQGIDIIPAVARLLSKRADLTFVVCGDGPGRRNLVEAAHQLPNLRIYDLQPESRLNELLGLATIHLLPQLGAAADLVLPSKLINMLASGRPVLATSPPDTALASEVAGAGIVIKPGDASALAEAIERLLGDDESYGEMSRRARARAVDRWDGTKILRKFESQLSTLVSETGENR